MGHRKRPNNQNNKTDSPHRVRTDAAANTQDMAMENLALYEAEVGVDFEERLLEITTDLLGSVRNIDWEQDFATNPDQKEMLTRIAAQFHFNNLNELTLCGTILENDVKVESKMIASLIAISKIRNIGTWGKYLARLNAVSDVPMPEKEYFNKLYNVKNTVSLLLGMSVIAKVTWFALTDHLRDLDDPLFGQIIDQVQQQKAVKLAFTTDYLSKEIKQMGPEELEILEQDARYYRGYARETVLFYRDMLETLDKDAKAVANHVEDEITQFYDDIGLTI